MTSKHSAHRHFINNGRRLSACVREVDTVARFGGDEFVVLLGELDVDRIESTVQARVVAEKIRVSLDAKYALPIEMSDGGPKGTVEHHCSTSIGVVVYSGDRASKGELLKWADAAMYQAKGAGRNAVRFYELFE